MIKKLLIVVFCLGLVGYWIVNTETVLSYDIKDIKKSKEVTYPRIFQAWDSVENVKGTENEKLAIHDLIFDGTGLFDIGWQITEEQPYYGLSTILVNEDNESDFTNAHKKREDILDKNPNIVILAEILYREGKYKTKNEARKAKNYWDAAMFPFDSTLWLRDESDEIVLGYGEDSDCDGMVEQEETSYALVDFTNEQVQDLIAAKALTIKESGLFNGIMLDWWKEDNATSGSLDWSKTYLFPQSETKARIQILKKIREKVGEDFLILVNANTSKVPLSAPYINGLFMEVYKDEYKKGYSLEKIIQTEETLLWAEKNLKEPHINCLEGWRVVKDYDGDLKARIRERQSKVNQQWMRVFTTMSLVFSDGYLLFTDDNAMPSGDHLHNWYSFWNVDLGLPIQEKGEFYKEIEGLFIREYENGWVIYNRSGKKQKISFEDKVTDVTKNKYRNTFEIQNLDGTIYLK